MKTAILLSFVFLLTDFHSYAQKVSRQLRWPGFIQLNDSVFMSQTELSIMEYAEFLNIMKIFFGSYAHFNEALPAPNTIGWLKYDPYRKVVFTVDHLYDIIDSSSRRYRSKEKQYNLDTNVSYYAFIGNRPIVNITKRQALLYCELRTKAFSTLKQHVRNKKGWHLPDSVYFRLPTIAELTLAASDKGDQTNLKAGSKVSNLIISRAFFDSLNTGESIPLSVYTGYINNKGFVNLCGNVSEMTMDSPFAFGGSFFGWHERLRCFKQITSSTSTTKHWFPGGGCYSAIATRV